MKNTLPTTAIRYKESLTDSKNAFQTLIYAYTARCAGIDTSKVSQWFKNLNRENDSLSEIEASDIQCIDCIFENLKKHYSTDSDRKELFSEMAEFLDYAHTAPSIKSMFLSSFKKILGTAN